MNASFPYRRAILGMGAGRIDRGVLGAAAEFARLLELEMLGIFVEDRSVFGLAALPFARELRLPGHDWRALEPQRVIDELRAAAERARQLFRQEVESKGVMSHFEVRRGDPVTLASAVATSTDVVIVAEPFAADRLAYGFVPAQRAALASAAAVLLLPTSGMSRRGPVAAVAAGPSDTCFLLATRIAAAAGEQAVAVPPTSDISVTGLIASLQRTLGQQRERLLVLTRGKSDHADEITLELARRRDVPILIVGSVAGDDGQAATGA